MFLTFVGSKTNPPSNKSCDWLMIVVVVSWIEDWIIVIICDWFLPNLMPLMIAWSCQQNNLWIF